MNRVQGSMTVMKDTMCGKIMMERVDSVTDSEKVAMNVVYENEKQGRGSGRGGERMGVG